LRTNYNLGSLRRIRDEEVIITWPIAGLGVSSIIRGRVLS